MSIDALLAAYWRSLLAFAGFALCHSVCAREPFKAALARLAGEYFVTHYWRIIYCAASFAGLYFIVSAVHWPPNPQGDEWLFDYPDWLWNTVMVLHLGSVAVIYVAFIQSDYLEFLGIKQAIAGIAYRARDFSAPQQDLFGTHRLVVHGIYAWLRHPMLAGGLWFLLTSAPTLNNLVYTGMYTTYMLIGGHYEERRLMRVFGDDYRVYKRRVWAYFPRLWPATAA